MFRNVVVTVLALAVLFNGYNLLQGSNPKGSLITLIVCSIFLLINIYLLVKEKRDKQLTGHDNPNKSTGNKYVDKL